MNENSDIKSKFKCLDGATIIKYLDNSLSRDEKRLIELHLADCELCSDAVEGYALIEDKSAISPIVENLKTELKLKNVFKANQNNSKRYLFAAAALIVVLFGLGLLFDAVINKKESQQIFADQFKPYPVTSSSNGKESTKNPDTGTRNEEQTGSSEKQNELAKDLIKTQINSGPTGKMTNTGLVNTFNWQQSTGYATDLEQKEKSIDSISDKRKEIKLDYYVNSKLLLEDEVVVTSSTKSVSAFEEKVVAIDDAKIVNQSYKKSPGTKKDSKQKNKRSEVNYAKSESDKDISLSGKKNVTNSPASVAGGTSGFNQLDGDLKLALEKYSSNDYKGAADDFDRVLDQSPANEEALFYSGVSNLSLNNVEKAITNFKKMLTNTKSKFYEPSKWYLALAYIKIAKKADAKKLLIELIDSKGEFKKQAEDLVKEL
ncbi:MAG: hypothetical protein HXX09_02945 [Bacteroidetes bacterium]|nr:hypothetical protein [Bacteroidota bacterium]